MKNDETSKSKHDAKKAHAVRKEHRRKTNRTFLLYIAVAVLIVILFALAKQYLSAAVHGAAEADVPEYTRKAHVAGTFYPAQKGTLDIMVNSFLESAEDRGLGDVHALVVPHAGYVYSGQVAAHGFKQLEGRKGEISKVFLIGNNHASGAYFKGISIPNYTHYETPLGKVKVSPIAAELSGEAPFTFNEKAHTAHILEVEIPFIQKMFGEDVEIIPMVVGAADQDTVNDAAKAINDNFDSSSILVVSSDLSHYHPYEDAVQLDRACVQQIETQSFTGVSGCEACGKEAILILLRLSQMNGWKAKTIEYKNSGDTTGDKNSVVGYGTVAFYTEPGQFNVEVVDAAEQEFLLELARGTVETYVREGKRPSSDQSLPSDRLEEVRGCFVTLNKQGALRGCIGHILPQKPLYECIIENAVNAASADPRFPPVTADELDDIHIDISVLTLPEELSYDSPEDLLSQLRPNIDGVVLRSGFRSSTYLPQVWEQLPDKQGFLESLCRKQGSPDDCWKTAKVSVYQAQVFEE
ncbi:AmmeMemoRadiSam system protein B [Candidatus Woesearchaeota archaeon]|nr:AmmeMemoRadiSam system protein B [Candidatus Woesearchaeota archaeon]